MGKITAWMIRADGIAVPCVQHIYANKSELDETLYAAEWLYKNTLRAKTRTVILKLIKSYAETLGGISAVFADIERKPYVFLTKDFINSIQDELTRAEAGNISELSVKVENALNNEFTRARYGGLYSTDKNSRDMYFRISSNGFDWYDIIYDFVKSRADIINTVTIVRDEESTGIKDFYYKSADGAEFKNYPLHDFLDGGKCKIK